MTESRKKAEARINKQLTRSPATQVRNSAFGFLSALGHRLSDVSLPTLHFHCVFFLLAAISSANASIRIPLTISEGAGVSRRSELVTSGVPFPQGKLDTDKNVRLLDEHGGEIPLQVQTTASWPDGSVKWLLLDFLADVNANVSRKLELEFGDGVVRRAKGKEVRVEQALDSLWINTGPLRFSISRQHFGVFDDVFLDEDRNGSFEPTEAKIRGNGLRQSLTLANEFASLAPRVLPPEEVLVEEPGPNRTVVKIVGWIDDGGTNRLVKYLVRVHAVAGSASMTIEHTAIQLSDRIKMLWVRDLSLSLNSNSVGPLRYRFGSANDPHEGALGDSPLTLSQLSENHYTLRRDGKEQIGEGLRAPGWFDLISTNGTVRVGVRHFWQQFPKAATLSRGGLRIGLYPAEAAKPFDMDQGLAKTHELTFSFDRDSPPLPSMGAVDSPLFAVAPSSWYCDSKVFGDLQPFDFDRFPDYETLTEASGDLFIKRLATGLRHWGDVYYGGEYKGTNSYMNLEYDVHHNFYCQFARTGLRKYLNTARVMAQHQADIDTNHKTGWQWKHSPRHVEIQAEFGHTFTRGLLETFYLTGNRRCRDAALTLGDYFIKQIQNPREMGNERQIGWGLISLLPVYEATWDQKYFVAASNTVERLLKGLDARGKFDIRWDNRIAFFNGIAATGFLYYYRATGDERVADAALRVIRRARGFYPEYAGRTLEALAWAYDRTREPEYLDFLKLTWETTMSRMIGANVMELGAPTIFTVHALPFLASSGLIPVPQDPLRLTPEQFSTENSLHAHHMPSGEAELYIEHDGHNPFELVLVRKGAWKAPGTATLFSPSGERLAKVDFARENALWQRRSIPITAQEAGAYRVALTSTFVGNSKGSSFVTWDVVTSRPKRAVFTIPDFEGLAQVTPYLFTVPHGDSTNVVLELLGEGEGFKKAVIFDPEDRLAGATEAFIDLGDKGRYFYKASAHIPATHREGIWKISLQDVSLTKLSGLVPYFSTSRESFFRPHSAKTATVR